MFTYVATLPLALQPPSLHVGCVVAGRAQRSFPSTKEVPIPTPIGHRSHEKKLEVSSGKRKY